MLRQSQTRVTPTTHILICTLLLLGTLLATGRALVLDTILVTGDGTGLAQRGHPSRRGVLEGLHGQYAIDQHTIPSLEWGITTTNLPAHA